MLGDEREKEVEREAALAKVKTPKKRAEMLAMIRRQRAEANKRILAYAEYVNNL